MAGSFPVARMRRHPIPSWARADVLRSITSQHRVRSDAAVMLVFCFSACMSVTFRSVGLCRSPMEKGKAVHRGKSSLWKTEGYIRCIALIALFLLLPFTAFSADPDSLAEQGPSLLAGGAVTAGYFALSLYVLGNTWYKDKAVVPFHFSDDNAAWMQVDKCGHAFGAYVYSYVGYHGMLAAGMRRRDALLFGATLGALMQTPIEIMDGLHEGYGFSWGDVVANTAGSGLVLGQELLFSEQLVKLKFSYSPSPYAPYGNGELGTTDLDRVLKDYNGQTYWLSLPITALVGESVLPPWICAAVGYGADGMYGAFDNHAALRDTRVPVVSRRRQVFFSLDVDWSRIETESPLLRLLLQWLVFVKLPFPAIEVTSDGAVRAHALFF